MIKFLSLAAAAALAAQAARAAELPSAPKPLPNIVIFAPDGLRADRLGAYGYARRPVSPSIDAAAKEGLVFESAESQASWALPGFASLFTSEYPHRHGALWSGAKVSPSEPLLAKLLTLRGYKTAGFVGSLELAPEHGLARGFSSYSSDGERRFQDTLPAAMSWIRENKGTEPLFVFVSGADLRPPFNPSLPKSLRDRFDPAYEDPTGDVPLDDYFVRAFDGTGAGPGAPPPDEDYKTRVEALRANPRALEHIGALYDGQVARVDEAFKRLTDFLKQEGLAQTTIVVLLSANGQELGERGFLGAGHRPSGREAVARVPLIFWGPGLAPGRRKDAARLIDVAPTLLALTATPPPAGYTGRDLLAPSRPEEAALVESTTVDSPEIGEYALRSGRWKLLTRPGKGGTSELYDLSADPEEKKDLSAKEAGTVRSLSEKLAGLTAAPR